MSLLDSIHVRPSVQSKPVIPTESISFKALVLGRIDPPVGSKRPVTLILVPLEDVEVPYYRPIAKDPSKSKNAIKVPVSDAKPIPLVKGLQSVMISMFKAPERVTLGAVYELQGVFYDMYKETEISETRIMLNMKSMDKVTRADSVAMVKSIPFANRSIDLSRDLMQEGEEYPVEAFKDAYHFVYVVIGGSGNDPETVYGKFLPVEGECEDAFVYKAKEATDPPIVALTGGRNTRDEVQDAMLLLQQNGPEGTNPVLIQGLTKVFYGRGLDLLQVDWIKMGAALLAHIKGDLYCQVNRAKTAEKERLSDGQILGPVKLLSVLVPDLAATVRSAGFVLSWNGCVSMEPRLATPGKLYSTGVRYDLSLTNAVNLAEFTGDASLIQLAVEKGWVEMVVVTNMPNVDAERRAEVLAMGEEDLVRDLMNKAWYAGFKHGRVTAVFAVPTETCPCPVRDLVSSVGKPVGAAHFDQHKRQKSEEEEEEL